MKIGNIEFGKHPLFLAPMEDVTDIGFRLLCKRFGAAMVYTEFISAEALVNAIPDAAIIYIGLTHKKQYTNTAPSKKDVVLPLFK